MIELIRWHCLVGIEIYDRHINLCIQELDAIRGTKKEESTKYYYYGEIRRLEGKIETFREILRLIEEQTRSIGAK